MLYVSENNKNFFVLMVFSFLLQHSFESMCAESGLDGFVAARSHKLIKRHLLPVELGTLIDKRKDFVNDTSIMLPLLGVGALEALVYSQAEGHPYVKGAVGLCGVGLGLTAGLAAYNKYIINSQPEMPRNIDTFQKMTPDEQNKIRRQGESKLKKLGGDQQQIDRLRTFPVPQEYADLSITEQQTVLPGYITSRTDIDANTREMGLAGVNNADRVLIDCYVVDYRQKAKRAQKVCERWNSTYQVMGYVTLCAGYALVLSKIISQVRG